MAMMLNSGHCDCIIVCIALSQVRCQVQELRVVLLQEGSAAEDDIPEVQLQLGRVRDKYFILTTAINISPQIFSGNKNSSTDLRTIRN